jgi:replicative DNA helicase
MALEGEEHEEIAAAAQRGLEEAILGPPPSTRRAVEVIDDIIADSKRPAIKTGFPKLDHRIKGFRLNTVNVLIGPTGGGKTSWALQTSSLISVNHPVIYGGLELTQSQLAARCLAQRLDIPWTEVLSGNFDPVKAREALEHLDLWFIAAGPNFLGAIERAISEAERRCPGVPILLVIDYVQLLAGEGDLRAATRSAALGIQRLTETRPVATLVLSQSSRANSKKMREGGAEAASEYIGAGLETGSIEHSAALQLVIEMPAENDVEESEGSMQIAKNRFGAQGAVGFAFAGATGTWRELDERPPSPKATRAQLRDTEDDEAVLAAIAKHPGRSWREIRPFAGVQGKRADLAKYRLLRSNRIEVKPVPTTRKDGRIINADAWFPVAEEDRY